MADKGEIAIGLGMREIDIITYPDIYIKKYVDDDNNSEVFLQLRLRKDKKDQVLKLLFGENNIEILHKYNYMIMETDLKVYAFEYNEEDGNFHQNFGDHEENTNGYKTLYHVSEIIWDPFSVWIKKRYNFIEDACPSFETVQEEWKKYFNLYGNIIRLYDKDEYTTFLQRLLFEKERLIQVLLEDREKLN